MSSRDRRDESESSNDHPQGPNLKLLYGLIALALLIAIGLAIMIVLPFYQRR